MNIEQLEEAKRIQKASALCEEFISNCDWAIRATTDTHIPSFDKHITSAIESGILTAQDLKVVLTDLRDICTVKLEGLDKELEAL